MDEFDFAEETVSRMKDLYGLAGSHEVIRRSSEAKIPIHRGRSFRGFITARII